MTTPLAQQRVGDLLAAIASTEPAPGAGSSAGVALALGLACARKALALTLKHEPDDPALVALAAHLAGLSDQALAGGEGDMRSFTAYIDALKVGDEAAKQAALADLLAVGENLIAIGDEARAKLLAAKADVRPSMINDVAAGLHLIAAARSIHAACVAETRRSAEVNGSASDATQIK